ncbi:hypothetical protein OUZ56_011419 [Daphnia magna]|uniref:Uncharacterized protein n=1 Tax=Daphnia magna TaxID=35525 RepID=A0ABQ9Z057_9CRUS|nr:hypothetical protein OUZ56_011419 [Daphnia magna]
MTGVRPCGGTSRDGQLGDVRFGDWNVVSAGYYPRVGYSQQVGYSQEVGYGQQVGFPPSVAYDSRYHPYNFRQEQATGHCFTASAN